MFPQHDEEQVECPIELTATFASSSSSSSSSCAAEESEEKEERLLLSLRKQRQLEDSLAKDPNKKKLLEEKAKILIQNNKELADKKKKEEEGEHDHALLKRVGKGLRKFLPISKLAAKGGEEDSSSFNPSGCFVTSCVLNDDDGTDKESLDGSLSITSHSSFRIGGTPPPPQHTLEHSKLEAHEPTTTTTTTTLLDFPANSSSQPTTTSQNSANTEQAEDSESTERITHIPTPEQHHEPSAATATHLPMLLPTADENIVPPLHLNTSHVKEPVSAPLSETSHHQPDKSGENSKLITFSGEESNKITPQSLSTTPQHDRITTTSRLPFKVFVLLLHPSANTFELIHIVFEPTEATVADLLESIHGNASQPGLVEQIYKGFIRPTHDTPDILDPTLPATPIHHLNRHMNKARRTIRTANIRRGEILIAIPNNYTGQQCRALAAPILKNPQLARLFDKSDLLSPIYKLLPAARSAKKEDNHATSEIRKSLFPPTVPEEEDAKDGNEDDPKVQQDGMSLQTDSKRLKENGEDIHAALNALSDPVVAQEEDVCLIDEEEDDEKMYDEVELEDNCRRRRDSYTLSTTAASLVTVDIRTPRSTSITSTMLGSKVLTHHFHPLSDHYFAFLYGPKDVLDDIQEICGHIRSLLGFKDPREEMRRKVDQLIGSSTASKTRPSPMFVILRLISVGLLVWLLVGWCLVFFGLYSSMFQSLGVGGGGVVDSPVQACDAL